MIVTTDAIWRKQDALLNSQDAVEILKAKGAKAGAAASQVKAKTFAPWSSARQASPIMVDTVPQLAPHTVTDAVGRQRGHRHIGGVLGGRYHER